MAGPTSPLSPRVRGLGASPLSLFVSVGTAAGGFDALVEAADGAARRLGIPGFAQIGYGRFRPRALEWAAFLPHPELLARLAQRPLVVCHGGAGIVGEALRAGCRVVCVPRRQGTSRHHPSNDQRAFVAALAARFPVRVCEDPADLESILRCAWSESAEDPPPLPRSDVPEIVAAFLRRTAAPPDQ